MSAAAATRRASWWARAALAALAALVAALAFALVRSEGSLLTVLGLALLCALVAVAAAWWAATTSRPWKRWLNLLVIAVLAAALVVDLVGFSLWRPLEVLAVAAAAFAFGQAARRALAAAPASAGAPPAVEAVPAPARPWLLVNPRSGGGTAGRTGLVAAARARAIEVHELVPGDDPVALARAAVAAGADAVGAAGGDGTLGLVASVAVQTGVAFVCVPAGTRNHFAHDLGLDRADPVGALDAFAGQRRLLDVGLIGDRVFLNNVSLGAYADVVADAGYRARKLATARVVLRASFKGERPALTGRFADRAGAERDGALVLLVANNRYQLERPSELGARDRLDEGVLQVSALFARTGAALAGIAARVVAGRLVPGVTWDQWTTTALRVDSDLERLPAGIDGESVLLAPPLEFRILPKALAVLVPGPVGPRARVATTAALSRPGLARLWALARG